MPNSNRRNVFGRGSGTVTVIEEPVMRSYARRAKATFYLVWAAVGLLSATVLVGHWEPRLGGTGAAIVALFAGAAIGLVPALITAAIVGAWPVIRAIWWWLPELLLVTGMITGWTELAAHTTLWLRLIATTAIVAVPAGIGPVRRGIYSLAWCQISRHRVRTCFSEFIITNRTGSLPLILAARPTPAGERLWIWLRPGLALIDITDRLDKIAAACWATSVVADQANPSNSALLRIDIKRRDPLTGTIPSPLTTVLAGAIPRRKTATVPLPVALDLPDIDPAEVTKPAHNGGPAPWPQAQPRPVKGPNPNPDSAPADDITDWI
jgi:hypothetical protein